MDCIVYFCIYTFKCSALHTPAYVLSGALHATAYLLVFHFTCIKGLFGHLVAQGYKLQIVPSK